MSMRQILIVLVPALVLGVQYSSSAHASLRLAGGPARKSQEVQGNVVHEFDKHGIESKRTNEAMNSEAQHWLKSMSASRSKVPVLQKYQKKSARDFEEKQAIRKSRFQKLGLKGIKDLYQQKIDHFDKARKTTADKDEQTFAKAAASMYGSLLGEKAVEVPHLTYSNSLTLHGGEEATPVRVELAASDDKKHMGLSHQTSVPEDAGMLFAFNSPKKHVLYMKDTPVPLEVGWFDKDGKLLEVIPMKANDETWYWTKSPDAVLALEMNQGFWGKNGHKPSKTSLNMEEVCNTLQAQGVMNHDLCSAHEAKI